MRTETSSDLRGYIDALRRAFPRWDERDFSRHLVWMEAAGADYVRAQHAQQRRAAFLVIDGGKSGK